MALPELIAELRRTLSADRVLHAPSELAVYDCDAYTVARCRPAAVVFPHDAREVASVVALCARRRVPVVPRGAGTGLAGGCLPSADSVVLMLTRLNRILEINLRDRWAVVEAGVANLQLARALAGTGYHYAPDPSSQGASTIGGNVATNAGGPHTLKYGVTINHVLGLEVVLGDGSIRRFGPGGGAGAPDIAGLVVGSEGRLGIVTKAWVRLTPNPHEFRTFRAVYGDVESATRTVSRIIAEGIIPAAMELMDRGIIGAVEDAYHFGFSREAAAVLIIELDGPPQGLDRQQARVLELCAECGAQEVLAASDQAMRDALWKCRKMAVGAVGRLSPSYFIQDGVVPRTQLPRILRRIAEVAAENQVRIVNVAHAGDGNVHPIILYDDADAEQLRRALRAGEQLLDECIACGGSVTAEHGIGIEKRDFMPRQYAMSDLAAMQKTAEAFDPFGILNPGKLLPDAAAERHVGGSIG